MTTRPLGRNGPQVSELGLGCMGMSEFYGPAGEDESVATIHRALALGITFLDTADMYGRGHNEELVGRAIHGRRDQLFLATKFGVVRSDDPSQRGISGRPEYVHQACDASLRRLGVDYIDLYYLHRVDPKVPIEDTVGAMAELVGISFVAYAPIGRGFLAGRFSDPAELGETDIRRQHPRFQGGNLASNAAVAVRLRAIAEARQITAAQLALAWLLARGDDIVPIPGTASVAHLEQNVAAESVRLTAEELASIDAAFPPGVAAGQRYADMSLLNR
jgi:aryl-alcohol dehydrogenase-like predicted oxidoreductase